MRNQINKLIKGHSTKAERKFMELCKQLHVPFRTKVMIEGREIDFLIGTYAIEIDSHPQDPYKNAMLFNAGYTPIHLLNWDITPQLVDWLKQHGTTNARIKFTKSLRNRSVMD